MKIQSSAVTMQGTHQYVSMESYSRVSAVMGRAEANHLQFGEGSVLQGLSDLISEKAADTGSSITYDNGLNGHTVVIQTSQSGVDSVSTKLPKSMKATLLTWLLELIRMRMKSSSMADSYGNAANIVDLRSWTGGGSANTLWTRVSASQRTTFEEEDTSFRATGTAYTSDGRCVEFGVEVGMSRSFMSSEQKLTYADYVLTDPLVLNLDAPSTEVTDQTFYFDLDADGEVEKISNLSAGSGFLALDKNNDGRINDGNELFGTKSGDGFKDLSKYDLDHNGWIDEADNVYEKLKVWTVDKDGNSHLLSLKEADVGAIYLGSVGTEFSLKDDQNQTNAVIRSSGVFLKESGGTGTVQQVDLAVKS